MQSFTTTLIKHTVCSTDRFIKLYSYPTAKVTPLNYMARFYIHNFVFVFFCLDMMVKFVVIRGQIKGQDDRNHPSLRTFHAPVT